jgi:hypothetical protein
MASHYFDNHNSPVTGGGGVQPIERVDQDIDGGIASERGRSRLKIVVGGFGDTDAINAQLPGIAAR